MKSIIKVSLLSMVLSISVNAYEIEKEGNWWYIYNGNSIVGAYSKMNWNGKYSVGCDSPKLSQSQKTYKDSSNYYMNTLYKTKREAKNAIIKYCKKR